MPRERARLRRRASYVGREYRLTSIAAAASLPTRFTGQADIRHFDCRRAAAGGRGRFRLIIGAPFERLPMMTPLDGV